MPIEPLLTLSISKYGLRPIQKSIDLVNKIHEMIPSYNLLFFNKLFISFMIKDYKKRTNEILVLYSSFIKFR